MKYKVTFTFKGEPFAPYNLTMEATDFKAVGGAFMVEQGTTWHYYPLDALVSVDVATLDKV